MAELKADKDENSARIKKLRATTYTLDIIVFGLLVGLVVTKTYVQDLVNSAIAAVEAAIAK